MDRSDRFGLAVLAALALVGLGGFTSYEKPLPPAVHPAPQTGTPEAVSLESTPEETNNIVTVAGKGVDIGDNGPATQASLLGSLGIAIHDGNLYISELFGNRSGRWTWQRGS